MAADKDPDTALAAAAKLPPNPVIQGVTLASLSIAIATAGFAMAWFQVLGEQSWFARAGSVIVALGIWSGLGGLVADRVFVRTHTVRRRLLVRRAQRRLRHDPQLLDQEVAKIEQKLEQRLDNHRDAYRLRVGVVEAVLLISGTLLWGFGDLIRYLR